VSLLLAGRVLDFHFRVPVKTVGLTVPHFPVVEATGSPRDEAMKVSLLLAGRVLDFHFLMPMKTVGLTILHFRSVVEATGSPRDETIKVSLLLLAGRVLDFIFGCR
jgi:hypothetical protein